MRRILQIIGSFHAARSIACLIIGCATPGSFGAGEDLKGVHNPIHEYWTRPPNTRFTQLKDEIEKGAVTLTTENERALLLDLLARLEIPVSSQLLVTSATSLQKGLIHPGNPRAIYFNEDTYVGWVPRGRTEVGSLDPELGAIFYIFDSLRSGREPRIARTSNCMNCHTPPYLGFIPALVVESVVPGMTGGGETAFRRDRTGHDVPLNERFGGWIVTGAPDAMRHWGNIVMTYDENGRHQQTVAPGELFDLGRYATGTSDILPHLLHEHQAGFVNRVLFAGYRFREWRGNEAADLSGEATERLRVLDDLARPVVEYLLFADEAPLPDGGIEGNTDYKNAFLANKRVSRAGLSLKDFDLRDRLFKHRCSYMIYSPTFAAMPKPLKERVYHLLHKALADIPSPSRFAYLPIEERRAIRSILSETLSDFSSVAPPTTEAKLSAGAR